VAVRILEELKKCKATSQVTVKTEKLWLTLIDFANTPPVDDGQKGNNYRKPMPVRILSSLAKMEGLPIPTVSIPVSPSAIYNNIIGHYLPFPYKCLSLCFFHLNISSVT
jgi:hypothetical protein